MKKEKMRKILIEAISRTAEEKEQTEKKMALCLENVRFIAELVKLNHDLIMVYDKDIHELLDLDLPDRAYEILHNEARNIDQYTERMNILLTEYKINNQSLEDIQRKQQDPPPGSGAAAR